MSDNQSENSKEWRSPVTVHTYELTELAKAEMDVKNTEEAIWQAEDAVVEAKRAHLRAKGYLAFVKDPPTWKKILCPYVGLGQPQAYTMCMQLGYGFVLLEGKIYKAGLPGEQLMDTGMVEGDIK
jgi:hypothetical protein